MQINTSQLSSRLYFLSLQGKITYTDCWENPRKVWFITPLNWWKVPSFIEWTSNFHGFRCVITTSAQTEKVRFSSHLVKYSKLTVDFSWCCTSQLTDYVFMSHVTQKITKITKIFKCSISAYFSDLHKNGAKDTADLQKKTDRNRNDFKITLDWKGTEGVVFILFSKVLEYLISPHAVLRSWLIMRSQYSLKIPEHLSAWITVWHTSLILHKNAAENIVKNSAKNMAKKA